MKRSKRASSSTETLKETLKKHVRNSGSNPTRPKKSAQQSFDFIQSESKKDDTRGFGGSLLKKSHAKSARPFSSRKTIHIVLRSSLAKGEFSLLKDTHWRKVKDIVHTQARLSNVRVRRYANAGNHIHLLISAVRAKGLARFLRTISGLIARLVLKTERGRPLPKSVRFWDQRPFSRIITWGKEYTGVARYLMKNTLEALGFIPYSPRPHSTAYA